MTEYMHRNGINMRYLGKLYTMLGEKVDDAAVQFKGDFKHLKGLVEREMVVRSAKHVFKSYLRDQLQYSQLHLSHVVSHLLNMLLCPQPFLYKLNNGDVKFHDDTIQSHFAHCPDAVQTKNVEKPKEEKQEKAPATEGELTKK